jgi:hypothetical protein
VQGLHILSASTKQELNNNIPPHQHTNRFDSHAIKRIDKMRRHKLALRRLQPGYPRLCVQGQIIQLKLHNNVQTHEVKNIFRTRMISEKDCASRELMG